MNMNELLTRAIQSIDRRKRIIITVTVAVAVLTAIKELLFPMGYTADTLLVVTELETGGQMTDVIPPPFNPAAYEQLALSNSVLGQVRQRMIADGHWEAEETPELEGLRENFEVAISVLDKTTRPINYSPIIRLTVAAQSEEIATALVDTWAREAVEAANYAVTLRIAAAAGTLVEERTRSEEHLELIWEAQCEEEARWNISVLQAELNTRTQQIDEHTRRLSDTGRLLSTDQERLRTAQQGLLPTILDEQREYKQELDALRKQLRDEETEFSMLVLHKKLNQQIDAARQASDKRIAAEQELAGAQNELERLQAALNEEEPFVELARAPSETAYWIAKSGQGQRSMAELEDSVMVSQELNEAYWLTKRRTQELLGIVASKEAEIAILAQQETEALGQQAQYEALLAEHGNTQDELNLDIHLGRERYDTMASSELLGLKSDERKIRLEIAGREADLKVTADQIEEIRAEQEELKGLIAEHTIKQKRLDTMESIAATVYRDIAQGESFVSAAHSLAVGKGPQSTRAIGLNLLSGDTYAIPFKGALGRKGRVLLTAFLTAALVSVVLLLNDVGVPFYRNFMEGLAK